MKRLMLVWVMILCMVPLGGWAEDSVSIPNDDIVDTVEDVMILKWAGEADRIMGYNDDETCIEIMLGRENDDGTEPVAIMRFDNETGYAVYYRRLDYQMPMLLLTDESAGADSEDDSASPTDPLSANCLEWAAEVYSLFHQGEPQVPPRVLGCSDEACCMIAFFEKSYNCDLETVLIFRLPAADGDEPQILAYVDVMTNGVCGYDGYLTADQAILAGREALRGRFGNDVADNLELEEKSFVMTEYAMDVRVLSEEFSEEPWQRIVLNSDHPTWDFLMIDPRAASVPEYENAYRYHVAVDAYTGEILTMSNEPEEYSFG